MSSTNFTVGYDAIVARIAALLPNHTRLPDSYNIDQNPERFLEKGWGLAIGPGGDPTNRTLGKPRTTSIGMVITVTRKSYALDLVASAKAETDKSLLEDARAIIDDIWQNNFNITGSPIVRFEGFSGVSPVKIEADSFLNISLNIGVEYFVS